MKPCKIILPLIFLMILFTACGNKENQAVSVPQKSYPYVDTVSFTMENSIGDSSIPVECYVRRVSKDSTQYISSKPVQIGNKTWHIVSMDNNLLVSGK